jgi:hypothetical protein
MHSLLCTRGSDDGEVPLVPIEKLARREQVFPRGHAILDLPTHLRAPLEFPLHDGHGGYGDVVSGAHDGVSGRDDGHEMSFVCRVDGGVPFFQIEGTCYSRPSFEFLEYNRLWPSPMVAKGRGAVKVEK